MSRFVTVSKERFFAYIGPRDIVLNTKRNEVIWEARNRTVVGRTTPGYACEHGSTKTYELTPEAYEASR
jgi:hypothetical protein